MIKHKKLIDDMLDSFGYNKSQYDEEAPETLYFDNGYCIVEEERDYVFPTIVGERSEVRPHYILMREFVEYNYPNEPDYCDIEEVDAFLCPLAAVAHMIVDELKAGVDGYLESLAEAQMEQDLFA